MEFLSSAAALGLLSALTWGSGDFCGGLASKRTSPWIVVFGVQLLGGLMLALLALSSGEALPGPAAMGWAAAGGVVVVLGLVALYTGLAQGLMGVVAPVSGVIGAALPIAFAAATVGLPGTLPLLGFALALLSVWLLSGGGAMGKGGAGRSTGLLLALIAGVGFGLFFVLLDRASEGHIWWPLVIARLTATVTLLPVVIVRARRGEAQGLASAATLIVLAAILDSAGNVFFVLAAQAGRVDNAAVLASLYSAVTVGLAWILLKERLTPPQWAGVAAALIAIPLIAL